MRSSADFKWISHCVAGPGCDPQVVEEDMQGCDCVEACTAEQGCSCLLYGVDNYDEAGRLLQDSAPILECHPNCTCFYSEKSCRNRVVGRGIRHKITVSSAGGKGEGAVAGEHIPKDHFVSEYAGEVIGEDEVVARATKHTGEHNYVLTVKEHYGGRLNITYIDPRYRGNVARFFNHSCSPNLRIVIVRTGRIAPTVGLFAARDITAGEELCYDYGESTAPSGRPCLCGTAVCRGQLPASATPIQ